jgi:molybdopterin/thiamine biosynthesis adenylyltransferase/rhodanese-related sulfurtransferase
MDARYSRQLALPGFGGEAQRRLGAAKVLVIGAGGLGSAVLPALAAAGIGTIGIIDDDRVELSNLHRQTIHRLDAVGTPKTSSATAAIHALNPGTQVTAYEHRLTAANALDLFAEFDLIVDGSDNFPTRYLAADAAVLTGKPLVWGAVSQYGGQASVSAPNGPGYRDLFPVAPAPGSVESCEVGGVLPTTVAVIGSIMATEVLKLVTGVGEPLVGRVTTYDALTGRFRELEFAMSSEPVTELIDYDEFCGGISTAVVEPVETRATVVEPVETLGTANLLDVRETWEAEIATLPGALLVPLGTLPDVIDSLDPAAEWVVYCHHGIRSQKALELMKRHGFANVRHLEGGIDAWARANDPSMARY